MLRKETVENFIKKLESKEPVPGGGSAAALAGSLAAALALMTINIASPKVNSRKTKDYLRKAKKKLNSLKKSLILLVDKDAEAYGKVAGAFKLPKNTEAEMEKRREKIQKCYKIAAIIPLKSAVSSFQAKGIIKNIKNLIPGNLVSDIEVAEYLAEAALKGAVANVRINLPGIKDKKFKTKANLALRKIK